MKQLKYLFILTLLMLMMVAGAFAQNSDLVKEGNAAYEAGEYEKAAQLYEQSLSPGMGSAEVYYNLGNAYFKSGKLGLAIVNYERAKKLAPRDEDIAFNLKVANEHVTDKIPTAPQLLITDWKNRFRNMFTEKGWSTMCITFFSISLFLGAVYIAGNKRILRKSGFWGGIVFFIFSVIAFFMAGKQHRVSVAHDAAIVTTDSVQVKGTPNEGAPELFLIHEGTKVKIENINGNWVEIRIANGNAGWLPSSSIMFI